jgi:hypothetical protein
MRSARGLMGSPRDMTEGLSPLSRLLRPSSPVAFRRRVHPPSSLPPLQSAATRCLLPVTSGRRATALGAESASHGVRSGPLRDTNQPEPPAAGSDPSPCYGPSSAFLPPSTVCSPTGLAGLFRPAAAYRVPAPQGFAPLRGAVPGCPGRCLRAVATSAPAVARAEAPTTGSKALLPAASPVASENGLGIPTLRAPPGLVLLRVLPLRATAACAASVPDLGRNEPAAPGPRRLADAEPGWPGIRLPTRTRFPA